MMEKLDSVNESICCRQTKADACKSIKNIFHHKKISLIFEVAALFPDSRMLSSSPEKLWKYFCFLWMSKKCQARGIIRKSCASSLSREKRSINKTLYTFVCFSHFSRYNPRMWNIMAVISSFYWKLFFGWKVTERYLLICCCCHLTSSKYRWINMITKIIFIGCMQIVYFYIITSCVWARIPIRPHEA